MNPIFVVAKKSLLLLALVFCFLAWHGRVNSNPAPASITFSKDIAPILNRRCVACHRADNIAPMPLRTFKQVKPWAAEIMQKVSSRQMPPWHAAPGGIQFANDRRLSDEEVARIVSWVKQGAPEGNPRDLPPPRIFPEGWQIGEPDAVFSMDTDYVLPSDFTDSYIYFRLPTNFKEDRWVQAVEFRPGNVKVVHHAVAYIETPEHIALEQRLTAGNATKTKVWSLLDTELPAIELMDGSTRRMKPDVPVVNDGCRAPDAEAIGGRNNSDVLSVYAPGKEADIWPAGTARKIPAGSNIVLQMHYSKAFGKVETDRTRVALIFAKAPVEKMVGTRSIINQMFAIPPHAPNQEVTACWTYQREVELISLMPHMHVRGKSMKYEVVYPDGRRQTLLDVPAYDFHWQTLYSFKEPLLIPGGSRIVVTAHFDNSERNMHNPDPTKTVRQGSATTDEMMIGFVNYAVPKPPARIVIKVDPKLYGALVGQYEFDPTAVVTIVESNGKLFLEADKQRVELLPISESTFVPDGRESELTFTRNEKGEVTGFVTTQNDTLARFKKRVSGNENSP